MKDELKKKLAEKLKIAKQKNHRSNVINQLPLNITAILKNSPYITTPELEKALMNVNQKWNFELHTHEFIEKYPNNRVEVSWEKDVLRFVTSMQPIHKQVYLLLDIENSPLFMVESHWAIQHFQDLWQCIDSRDFWLFDEDLTFGLLICRYGGYLEDDPNPEEYFYAITHWGT